MSTAKTQKALLLPSEGAQWQLGESPIPSPGPKDVIVKIAATALNPVDWKVRTITFLISGYPFIGGSDGAGTIEEVGSEVSNFTKGDKV